MLNETLTDETVDNLFAESFIQGFGARPVYGAVRKYIEDNILTKPGVY